MQKIIPHLWFDSEAEQAVQFYASLLKDSHLGQKSYYTEAGFEIHGQPAGKLMSIEFQLAGQDFIAINGGPFFKFNPSISFLVACETKEEVDQLWTQLSPGGKALMDIGEYPFSPRYGWLEDRYGLSWQLMFSPDRPIKQKITPTLMFVGEQCGRAEEAINLYTSIFDESNVDHIMRYDGSGSDKSGTVQHAGFTLAGQDFAAMDSALDHKFQFSEAISFLIPCKTQEEIDFFWNKLTPGGYPKAQQCGWLKDKFGVSWQVSPNILRDMLHDSDQKKVANVTNAFMPMHKLDIAALKKAFDQE